MDPKKEHQDLLEDDDLVYTREDMEEVRRILRRKKLKQKYVVYSVTACLMAIVIIAAKNMPQHQPVQKPVQEDSLAKSIMKEIITMIKDDITSNAKEMFSIPKEKTEYRHNGTWRLLYYTTSDSDTKHYFPNVSVDINNETISISNGVEGFETDMPSKGKYETTKFGDRITGELDNDMSFAISQHDQELQFTQYHGDKYIYGIIEPEENIIKKRNEKEQSLIRYKDTMKDSFFGYSYIGTTTNNDKNKITELLTNTYITSMPFIRYINSDHIVVDEGEALYLLMTQKDVDIEIIKDYTTIYKNNDHEPVILKTNGKNITVKISKDGQNKVFHLKERN